MSIDLFRIANCETMCNRTKLPPAVYFQLVEHMSITSKCACLTHDLDYPKTVMLRALLNYGDMRFTASWLLLPGGSIEPRNYWLPSTIGEPS